MFEMIAPHNSVLRMGVKGAPLGGGKESMAWERDADEIQDLSQHRVQLDNGGSASASCYTQFFGTRPIPSGQTHTKPFFFTAPEGLQKIG